MKKPFCLLPVSLFIAFGTLHVSALGGNDIIDEGILAGMPVWTAIVVAVLVVIAGAALIAYGRLKLKVVRSEEDDVTQLGNARYMRKCYDEKIGVYRSSYCFAYIGFDEEEVRKRYGDEKANDICKFASRLISDASGNYDYLAKTEEGIFTFAFRYSDKVAAIQRITGLNDRINRYIYSSLSNGNIRFRAGIFTPDNSANNSYDVVYSNMKLAYTAAVEKKIDICVCTPELLRSEAFRGRLSHKLSHAIDNEQFEPFVQLIYDTESEKFIGGEVLSRWNSPENGFLMPAHYINDMIATGVIVKFDYYMISRACRLLEEWKKCGYSHLTLSCNVTRITISEENFLQKLRSIAKKHDFDYSKLILEITEDAFVDNKAVAYKNISDCKEAGFGIAIDDFGAGHSAVSDLCDYPVDFIKVDRSIILKSNTARGLAVLKGLIDLSHNLGIKVLCEGVETEEQDKAVKELNADFIQGYLYSYVLSVAEVKEKLQQ